MIITFATQKGGTGKTTLAIAFANYIATTSEKQVKVYDFDFQKSFYEKWVDDETSQLPKLYDVESIGETTNYFSSLDELLKLKESDEINIFDLAGTLDENYSDLLVWSDFVIIPFEYSDISVKSTMVFINVLSLLESMSDRIFIRSKYDKGYKYLNQEEMDELLQERGKLIPTPIFKRNCLQLINTRTLNYEQKLSVKKPFTEIIDFINETSQITI